MGRSKSKTRCIGILTVEGDRPGLKAAIRAVAKAAIGEFGIRVIGVRDGFLTLGGTLLGTNRD